MEQNQKIAVIGLGYVGLPLAVEFAKKYSVFGYDIDKKRINQLKNGIDYNQQISSNELSSSRLKFTTELNDISKSNVYIITVPTPIDESKKPDLTNLKNASIQIGSILKKQDIVIYESTTYPGCTEEFCVPILEKISNLKFNQDFFVGYSPERISPGKNARKINEIIKITSGSNPKTAHFIDELYQSIITAGTYKAPSIKVAEAAKSIENAQRDLNISFVNELAIIFEKLNLDTNEVLAAAATKWNFHHYKPGLVGGHCISVDPYYLAHKAEQVGYQPNVILSGRRVNDQMGKFVASKLVKLMVKKEITIRNANVLILGITFKENCPDIRNSKVIDTAKELLEFGCNVDFFDPFAVIDGQIPTKLNQVDSLENKSYDGIILAVAHDEFKTIDLSKIKKPVSVVYDLKSFFDQDLVDARL